MLSVDLGRRFVYQSPSPTMTSDVRQRRLAAKLTMGELIAITSQAAIAARIAATAATDTLLCQPQSFFEHILAG